MFKSFREERLGNCKMFRLSRVPSQCCSLSSVPLMTRVAALTCVPLAGASPIALSNTRKPTLQFQVGEPVEKMEVPELLCPLCRGQVKGWTVVEPTSRSGPVLEEKWKRLENERAQDDRRNDSDDSFDDGFLHLDSSVRLHSRFMDYDLFDDRGFEMHRAFRAVSPAARSRPSRLLGSVGLRRIPWAEGVMEADNFVFTYTMTGHLLNRT
ncbi:hypothetical protein F3Y22_tig00117056pilonHSYRG00404 [Hibiscus syriacus]|uniref:Uncharacterized protein n=1 Tax=Hibiscus syriacus TaxID=106335 RepID=A0A6A2X683_HIBSY|nr:hypothetical protein F3Y22_tig00117056pilonHSYRG00404 [Hibiscus syriacus]